MAYVATDQDQSYTVARTIEVSDTNLANGVNISLQVGEVLFEPVLDSTTMMWYFVVMKPN